MRLAILFLRTRRAGWSVLAMAGTVGAAAGLRAMFLGLWEQDFLTSATGAPIPVVSVFLPLALALLVGGSIQEPFGEVERTASRPLPPLRLAHAVGLILVGAAMLVLLALTWEAGNVWGLFLRNLAGFAGLALLAAPVLGGRLAWLVPLGFGMIVMWLGDTNDPEQWAWPLAPAHDGFGATVVLAVVLGGLAAASVLGGRDSPGEV